MTDDVLGDQAIDGLTTMQTLRLGELVLESINERLDNGEPWPPSPMPDRATSSRSTPATPSRPNSTPAGH